MKNLFSFSTFYAFSFSVPIEKKEKKWYNSLVLRTSHSEFAKAVMSQNRGHFYGTMSNRKTENGCRKMTKQLAENKRRKNMSISTSEYLDILKEQVNLGKEVSMIITGNSMSPFLMHGRDVIYFKKPEKKLRPGDMVFFQRKTGQYVMHRLYKIKKDGYYFIGDGQTEIEGPLPEAQIFAIISKVKRKNKVIDHKSFWWFFFSHIWLHLIPFRPFLIALYRKVMN